ncbi:rho GTPase-activating protein 42 isoform X1, partial [Tachysurus ichikawai]
DTFSSSSCSTTMGSVDSLSSHWSEQNLSKLSSCAPYKEKVYPSTVSPIGPRGQDSSSRGDVGRADGESDDSYSSPALRKVHRNNTHGCGAAVRSERIGCVSALQPVQHTNGTRTEPQ